MKLLGMTMEECSEFGWGSAMHPDEVQPTVAAWKECVRVQGKWDNEPRFRGADGKYHPILARGMTVRDEHGSILCWAGINLDISRLKQAEQELQQARDELELRVQRRTAELTEANRRLTEAERNLQESEKCYLTVIEDQTEVVSRLRADGTFLFANAIYCRTFGKSPGELIGQRWAPIAHPDDVPRVEAALATLSPDHPVVRIENRVCNGEGELRWMEFVNRGFFDADGKLIEFQSVGRDMTDRKQIEEQLRTSLREKDALLKEVRHRVKNNLAITVSLLNFQIRKTVDAEVIETLRQAQNRVRSMAMVHELLYHSESLVGINLLAYVKQLTRQLLVSYDATNRIRLEVCIPPMELLLDAAIPFGLILNELISNACKHAYPTQQSGRLLISVNQEPGGFVRLVVADDGVGVPDGVDPISSRSLGLRLVRDLTQQLGGTLELIRSPGTAFHIRFPANSGTKA